MVSSERSRLLPLARLVSRLDRRVRLGIILAAGIAFVLLYLALHDALGILSATLSVIPVVVAGLLFGSWGGLIASPISLGTILFLLYATSGWDPAGVVKLTVIVGLLLLLVDGLLVGELSEAGQHLDRELSKLKRVEAELKASQEYYRSLFEGIPVGLYRTAPDGRILNANPVQVQMLGYPDLQTLLSVRATDLYVDPSERERQAALLRRQGVVHDFEIQLYRYDGKVIWVRDSVRAVYDDDGQLSYYEGSLEDISERKQVEQAEREQRILAEALRDTAAALTSTLQFDEVLDRILTNLGRVVPHDAANIMLLENGVARLERSRGYLDDWGEQERRAYRFPVAEIPTLQQMVETGQPLAIPDTHQYPGWVDLPHSHWLRSYAGAPIRVRGHMVGFLNLNSATVGYYTPEKAERLQAFADQAAVAIENARLFEEVQGYARQMTLLNDVTRAAISAPNLNVMLQRLADRLGELISADGAYITLWDEVRCQEIPTAAFGPHRQTYASIPVDPNEVSMTASVLRAGRALVAEDVFNSPYISPRIASLFPDQSMLGLPLMSDGKPLGAALITFRHRHQFTLDEIALGEQAAAQIALAISKAQLLESERQRTAQLARANRLITDLGQVATWIATAKGVEPVLETLGKKLNQMGIHCLVALQAANSDSLAVHYLSLDAKALDVAEKIAGRSLRNARLSSEQLPYYADVVLHKRAIFSPELKRLPEAVFPGIPPARAEKVAEYMGTTPGKNGFFLPLAAGEQVLGALWMWGEGIHESDLPAASLFAGQVAVALENAHLYEKIKQMAITDDLTGLYNRRGLLEIGRREAERAFRFGHALAAVLIDIDHFKRVNDTYSHAVGDQVLRSFAACCKRNVREIDIIGRIGGEEFVILLPETDLASAQKVAERLRKRIEENLTQTEMGEVHITVSIGVAAVGRETKDLLDLIRRADEAMFVAKNSGRNTVAACEAVLSS